MSNRWDRPDVRLTTDIGPTSDALAVAEDTPFVVGVLGDFTARRETSVSVTVCKPVEIDRDNFDAVMERLNIKFEASLDSTLGPEAGGWSGALVLRKIDSFHPDEILKQIEPLGTLIELRHALENPAKFSAAAGEIQKWLKTSAHPADAPATQTPSNLLQTILEEANPSAAATPRKKLPTDIERLVQTIVSPHAIRLDVGQQQQLVAAVDAVLGERLKAILHDAEFQQLEAAWRSLRFLVMNAETGSALKIYLLNLSKAELANDMMRSRDLSDSDLFKALSSFASGSGGQPWGVLVGNYAFSRSAEDIHILDHVAKIAHNLRAPFVAGVSPQFFGAESFTDLPSRKDLALQFGEEQYTPWRNFRKSPQAKSVGLLLPRFLLRVPYGAKTDPIASFFFEEGVVGKDHGKYVWGNPAFAFATILMREFSEDGWSLNPARAVGQLDGLPLHVYEDDGASEAKPCAEVLISEDVVGAIEEEGFMPLVSYRDRDFIVIHCAQSVASPPVPLAGRW